LGFTEGAAPPPPQEQQLNATWKVIKFAGYVLLAIWFLI
jgi:hypothetical protein